MPLYFEICKISELVEVGKLWSTLADQVKHLPPYQLSGLQNPIRLMGDAFAVSE